MRTVSHVLPVVSVLIMAVLLTACVGVPVAPPGPIALASPAVVPETGTPTAVPTAEPTPTPTATAMPTPTLTPTPIATPIEIPLPIKPPTPTRERPTPTPTLTAEEKFDKGLGALAKPLELDLNDPESYLILYNGDNQPAIFVVTKGKYSVGERIAGYFQQAAGLLMFCS